MKDRIKKNSVINTGPVRNLLRLAAAEKKKTITAACLSALMAFMWIRLFMGKNVQDAQAVDKTAVKTTQAENVEDSSVSKVTFIELPFVKGRNDMLKRDFFSVDKKGLGDEKQREVELAVKANERNKMDKIAALMRLEAILIGERSQAYINDKIRSVGDVIVVSSELQNYECEVIRIEQMEVTIKCGEGQFVLKIAQPDLIMEEK